MSAVMKPIVFHVGDLVTVEDPRVVVRVGYPLFLGDVIDQMEKQHATLIQKFIVDAGFGGDGIDSGDYRLFLEIVKAVAGAHMRAVNFGGRERSIHTETNEKLRGTKGWLVLSKRVVKTGVYERGGYSYSYDGEGDYDPPYLGQEKSHVLLSLMHENGHVSDWNQIEIEAVNCTKEHP